MQTSTSLYFIFCDYCLRNMKDSYSYSSIRKGFSEEVLIVKDNLAIHFAKYIWRTVAVKLY